MKPESIESRIQALLADPRLQLDPAITLQETVGRFARYVRLWEKWNARTNLTGEKTAGEFLENHLFLACQYFQGLKPEGRVMDIGSGAGLPGIPLKILYPQLDLVLVESRQKRASFLRTVCRDLELSGTTVKAERAEDLEAEFRGSFDAVLFRAVGPLADCLKLGAPFLKSGGVIRILKTAEAPSPDVSGLVSGPSRTLLNFRNEPLVLLSYIKE